MTGKSFASTLPRVPASRGFGPPAVPIRTFLPSLLLSMLLSACSPPIRLNPAAAPCPAILMASGLLEPTAGATRPVNDTVGEIAAFAVRQTGQVAKGNADKDAARKVLTSCDTQWRAALDRQAPRPWWQFWR